MSVEASRDAQSPKDLHCIDGASHVDLHHADHFVTRPLSQSSSALFQANLTADATSSTNASFDPRLAMHLLRAKRRFPSGDIGARGRWCSRLIRAARESEGRGNRPACRGSLKRCGRRARGLHRLLRLPKRLRVRWRLVHAGAPRAALPPRSPWRIRSGPARGSGLLRAALMMPRGRPTA
jgi:hypothetical protein